MSLWFAIVVGFNAFLATAYLTVWPHPLLAAIEIGIVAACFHIRMPE